MMKRIRPIFFLLLCGAVLSGIGVVSPSADPGSSAPPLSWNPAAVTQQVSTGGTKSLVVMLSSSRALTNLQLSVVPELRNLVSLPTTSVASVQPGQPVPVTLSLSAAANATPGTYSGTLHATIGNTIAKPLPITITVCRCVTANSLSLTYPQGWQLDQTPLDLGGPISLNNFGNKYQQGGIAPLGGAVVDITSIPLPLGTLTDFIAEELLDSTVESTSQVTVGGAIGTRVVSVDSYTPTTNLRTVAIYLPHGTLLYKIYLTYNVGDPSEALFLSDFQQMLSALYFV